MQFDRNALPAWFSARLVSSRSVLPRTRWLGRGKEYPRCKWNLSGYTALLKFREKRSRLIGGDFYVPMETCSLFGSTSRT